MACFFADFEASPAPPCITALASLVFGAILALVFSRSSTVPAGAAGEAFASAALLDAVCFSASSPP